ncbi:MAG: hypothetical protein ABI551_17935, partial [Polyangiaceae bacterium]
CMAMLIAVLFCACSGDDNGGAPPTPTPDGGTGTCDCTSLACQATGAADAATSGVVTSFYDSTRFIWAGAASGQCAGQPLQTGVGPTTIDPKRAAALVGKIADENGQPVAGVAVTVVAHPEFGQTTSGPDGAFVMVVNGGGALTARYAKAGLVPVQRHAPTRWLDYAHLADAVMRPTSGKTTAVTLGGGAAFADGDTMTDADGTRTAHVYFAPGTKANVVAQDGSKSSLSSFHVRMTELTTGPTGQASMPADLPPATAYTYCTSFDVVEAPDAQRVDFDPPAVAYVDDFLGFKVGTSIPAGAYVPGQDTWQAAKNGVAFKVLTAGSTATIDADGDGKADSAAALAALGISSDELASIGSKLPAGATFWRVPLPHFSFWDFNPGWGLPKGAKGPDADGNNENKNDCSSSTPGSIIHCESAGLGEAQPLAGTGQSLMYLSERQLPYEPSRSLNLRLTGDTVPPGVVAVQAWVDVAGQHQPVGPMPGNRFAATPNLTAEFRWDGKNVLGEQQLGTTQARVTVDYLYKAVYSNDPSFGAPTDGSTIATSEGDAETRGEIALETTFTRPMTVWDERVLGGELDGWTLADHHVLDPFNGIVHFGYGDTQSVESLGSTLFQISGARDQTPGYAGDGGPAANALFDWPHALAVSDDGSAYICDERNHAIRKIDASGIVTTIAGNGTAGFSGDGGPAKNAQLSSPFDVALGRDGSIYIADSGNRRVRKITPNGVISTVAGTGNDAYDGDGGPATSASIREPHGLAVGPDGSLYVTDTVAENLRRITADGTITTIAGANPAGTHDVVGPASAAALSYPSGVTVAPDGTIYVADAHVVWKIRPDGTIERFAGMFQNAGFSGDGGPALSAQLDTVHSVAVGADGVVYLTDRNNTRVRAVDPSGTIRTVAGGGTQDPKLTPGSPLAANLAALQGLALDPAGGIWFTDYINNTLFRFAPSRPLQTGSYYIVPSRDGRVAYAFDLHGRHLKTIDAVTGVTLLTFGYDASGKLSTATDRDGNTTTFERDALGCMTKATSPWGHVTTFTCDIDGYVASVTDPDNAKTTFVYDKGLMTSRISARGDVNNFLYDYMVADPANLPRVTGRLVKDTEPWGGFKTLGYSPNPGADGWDEIITTAEGRKTTHSIQFTKTGDEQRYQLLPDNHFDVTIRHADQSTHHASEFGGLTDTTVAGDPRFDMMAPLGTTTYATPAGNGMTSSLARAVTLPASGDPTAPSSYGETATLGGQSWNRVYDASTRTWLVTTPEGRTEQRALDGKGHVVEVDSPGVAAVHTVYDGQGRVTTVTQDARTWGFTYDGRGNLATSTDPLNHTWRYAYDAVGRVTQTTRADGQIVGAAYDADGNVTSVTPASKPAHGFDYFPGPLAKSYTPPSVSGGGSTSYAYDKDALLTTVSRPDARSVGFEWNAKSGKLDKTTSSAGTTNLTYDSKYGSLTSVADPSGETTTLTNDAELLLGIAWSGPVTGSVSFQYDNLLRVSQETAAGSAISYGYDNDNLITTAGDESLTRQPNNGYLQGTSIGAASDAYTYSQYGELATHAASVSGTAIFSQNFTRDALGRVSSLDETIDGATHTYGYTYDLADRLATVTIDGAASSSYTYDGNGNATSATVRGVASSGAYDAQDRMTSYGSATYDWNANGELAAKHEGGNTTTYATDSVGRLQNVTLPGGITVSYVYDGSNRRVGRKVNGTLAQGFLYRNALKPVAELDG